MYVAQSASATVSGCTFRNNTNTGVYVGPSGAAATTTVSGCLIQGSGTYGVRLGASSGATSTVNLTNNTIHGNGTYGVYISASTGASSTANVKNSNVTGLTGSGQQYGIYRVTGSGSTTATTTYSNVWGNSLGNYTNASEGTGCISANPLYASIPTNMRLTSNSPSRFAGDAGGDLGPLDYVNDATPGYHGTLWVNTTLTAAGSRNWYGVVLPEESKGATLTNVNLQYASYAVRSAAAGAALSLTNVSSDTSNYGYYLTAGTPTLKNPTANNGSYGMYVAGLR
ncbi:right-handed parallel beta-helix repeat-containing protein [Polyangium spumosum]|uniref:right-handed parallel beta-helix repeat-containing protein n=1 Tax=Polyangium spumosum TaxID=889282 RepID=UPI001F0D86BF|nr:right-handed parallel beta-helix repeat-containing protein [Polyangium spumosum]